MLGFNYICCPYFAINNLCICICIINCTVWNNIHRVRFCIYDYILKIIVLQFSKTFYKHTKIPPTESNWEAEQTSEGTTTRPMRVPLLEWRLPALRPLIYVTAASRIRVCGDSGDNAEIKYCSSSTRLSFVVIGCDINYAMLSITTAEALTTDHCTCEGSCGSKQVGIYREIMNIILTNV